MGLPLAEPEADARAEFAPDGHGLRVVVAVDVRHEEPGDVAKPESMVLSDCSSWRGLLDRPPGVDHDDVVVLHDGVDVDGPQAVHGSGNGMR